jgi:hypothetical protein
MKPTSESYFPPICWNSGVVPSSLAQAFLLKFWLHFTQLKVIVGAKPSCNVRGTVTSICHCCVGNSVKTLTAPTPGPPSQRRLWAVSVTSVGVHFELPYLFVLYKSRLEQRKITTTYSSDFLKKLYLYLVVHQ